MRLFTGFVAGAALLALSCLAAPRPERAPLGTFEGRTVVVTGANRGIGLELARQLVAGGAAVIGTARDPDEATGLAATGARVLALDVTDEASVAAFAKALGGAVDVLINNAGVLLSQDDPRAPDLGKVERTVDVNLMGPIRVTYALLPRLLEADLPTVVNVTSTLGSIENNTSGGFLGYRESKAGLNMFTRSLAQELKGEGLVALAVHPGWVSTDMGGPNAPVTPAESARGILELVAGAGGERSGRYFDSRDGKPLPW